MGDVSEGEGAGKRVWGVRLMVRSLTLTLREMGNQWGFEQRGARMGLKF